MSEIGDRAREKLSQMDLYLTCDGYLSSKDIDQILSIPELAVVDREAGIEFLDLGTFYSVAQKELLMAGAKAQADKMLKEDWVREVQDE